MDTGRENVTHMAAIQKMVVAIVKAIVNVMLWQTKTLCPKTLMGMIPIMGCERLQENLGKLEISVQGLLPSASECVGMAKWHVWAFSKVSKNTFFFHEDVSPIVHNAMISYFVPTHYRDLIPPDRWVVIESIPFASSGTGQ